MSFGGLIAFALRWISAITAFSSEAILKTIVSALIALLAMNLTSTFLYRRLHARNRQLRTAIDSMAQGMCMFDAAERVVVGNTQYYEMYGLTMLNQEPSPQ